MCQLAPRRKNLCSVKWSQRTHLQNIWISQLEDTFQLLFSLTCLSKLIQSTGTWDFVCPPQNEIACHKIIGFSVETARSPEWIKYSLCILLPSTSAKVKYYFLAFQCTSGTREVRVMRHVLLCACQERRRNKGGNLAPLTLLKSEGRHNRMKGAPCS